MNTYLVAVVDGTTARFLTLKPLDFPQYESGPKLVELDGLFTDEKEQSGADLWGTTKPGRNRGTLGQAHGYDDHREQHMAEFSQGTWQDYSPLLSMDQVCAPQVSFPKYCSAEVGPPEIRTTEISTAKVCPRKISILKLDSPQVCRLKRPHPCQILF